MIWPDLDAAPRYRPCDLTRRDIPREPGVYAWYRRGRAVYVGKADDLQERIWARHLGESRTLGTSALRRNVAESLGFGASAEIKNGRVRLTPAQLAQVRAWICGCRVTWLVLPSAADAIAAEMELKAERMPRLTKR
jgi:hypothetical protein